MRAIREYDIVGMRQRFMAELFTYNTPNIGQTITFTLEVINAGPDVATNATVTDVVPAGFTYVAASISGGSSSNDTDPAVGGLTWTLNSLPVGTPFLLTFDAVVNAP